MVHVEYRPGLRPGARKRRFVLARACPISRKFAFGAAAVLGETCSGKPVGRASVANHGQGSVWTALRTVFSPAWATVPL